MEEGAKKRILYFISEFPRISETFIEREISKLIEWDNLDITVLSLSKATGSTSEEVLKQTVYKRLRLADFLGGLYYVITCPKEVTRCYKLALELPNRSFFSKMYFLLKSLGYTKTIADLKPQHIHAHFLSWPSTTALIASHILDIPFSISAHARDVFMEGELIPQKIESAIFVSICNSYAYKKALEIAGGEVDKSKVKLIYHGIDSKIFESPPKMPKWDVPAIFLGGTRLVEKKGFKYMIEASKILRDKGFAHRVDLVGPGDLYQELVKMIDVLRLGDVVFIHGEGKGTAFKEVLEYYKVADIFVLPSVETGAGDVDGVPTVVIEAAMARLPIVSTDAGGITDLIEDSVTGIIIEQKNPQAIANAIEKLLLDKDLANKLSQNAYAKAIKMFNIYDNIGQLESLLV
ncbi:MAG: glycosyltransferase family 4 protein [Patescibacteria group bacterium]